jgi:hypothetical protein
MNSGGKLSKLSLGRDREIRGIFEGLRKSNSLTISYRILVIISRPLSEPLGTRRVASPVITLSPTTTPTEKKPVHSISKLNERVLYITSHKKRMAGCPLKKDMEN